MTLDTFGERSYYNAAGQKSREAYLARHPLTAQNDRRDIGSKHSADKAVKTGLNYYNDVSHSAKHLLPTHHLGGPEVGAYHRVHTVTTRLCQSATCACASVLDVSGTVSDVRVNACHVINAGAQSLYRSAPQGFNANVDVMEHRSQRRGSCAQGQGRSCQKYAAASL